MEVIKIVEDKTAKNGSAYKVVETDKQKYACWEASLFPMLDAYIGKPVAFDVQQKGEWRNIIGITPIEANTPTIKNAPIVSKSDKPTREDSIVAQCCLKAAIELFINKEYESLADATKEAVLAYKTALEALQA